MYVMNMGRNINAGHLLVRKKLAEQPGRYKKKSEKSGTTCSTPHWGLDQHCIGNLS
jgi:hypothetical protein